MEQNLTIQINTPTCVLALIIYSETPQSTLVCKSDSFDFDEALYQIKEGCYYEYQITEGYQLKGSEIVFPSKINSSLGRLVPNVYVGTVELEILDAVGSPISKVSLEVQSVKTEYREDYRRMLEEITEKCVDLVLLHSSPAAQNFEPNFEADAETLYQRFAFIKSVIDTEEFTQAVYKITSAPVTKWKNLDGLTDIRSIRRFSRSSFRQLTSSNNRINLPQGHSLQEHMLTVPGKINVTQKVETVDTPENRFVKYVLVYILQHINEISITLLDTDRVKIEADRLALKLELDLSHSIFREISTASTLQLNSPILQRKEGYREVYRLWLMFDLAAKLIWKGGDDVYKANKKDVAILYEYWLFFKMIDIVKEVFNLESKLTQDLIEETKGGIGLKLKQGRHLPVQGIYDSGSRKLEVEFSYNKTFSGNSKYPRGGSWSSALRPDYTLTIWPAGITQIEAEQQELIVHVHFDAKYKVESLKEILGTPDISADELTAEKKEERKGSFKRADILKMHTYRDAIRRTAGAYVLYPGSKSETKQGFHEILPGLGAFAISPSSSDTGSANLKSFLKEVVEHFLNRASQREKQAFRVFDIHKNPPASDSAVKENLPEAYNENRSMLPDETHVLIGYCRKEVLQWILKTNLYNARTENRKGSLPIGPEEWGAKFLLLHPEKESTTGRLFRIMSKGPKIYSKKALLDKGYPGNHSDDIYLVYTIEPIAESEFKNLKWDISKLDGYQKANNSAKPFTCTLGHLMSATVD